MRSRGKFRLDYTGSPQAINDIDLPDRVFELGMSVPSSSVLFASPFFFFPIGYIPIRWGRFMVDGTRV
jgi:hypothetical protein